MKADFSTPNTLVQLTSEKAQLLVLSLHLMSQLCLEIEHTTLICDYFKSLIRLQDQHYVIYVSEIAVSPGG